MNKKFYLLLALLFLALVSQAGIWEPDSLGDGIEYTKVAMPDDYSGKVVSTVVRKLSPCASGRAVLYIHGFNDYFFQQKMADRFVDSCYNFYAVDLRKYGRSYRDGQLHCDARNINEYFPDIDSALSIIASSGVKQPILFVSKLLAELLLQGYVIKIVDTHGVAYLTHGLSCHLTGLF